ncbi:MAG: hypothetical protein GYA55_00700, partial [SAR324 cluster bacterium]|nr:hypothetical protein [SAR324 cluster bacterium]
KTLREDSRTTGDRAFIAVCMGRDAGFLSLGIAHETDCFVMLPEEAESFDMKLVIDTIVGSLLKGQALAEKTPLSIHDRGAVVLVAEGVISRIAGIAELVKTSFPMVGGIVLDEYGNIRLAKIPSQNLLEWGVINRFKELGVPQALKATGRKLDIISEKVGFGLRCAAPCEEDVIFTSALGEAAARFALEGATEIMVVPTSQGIRAMPFDELLDSAGKTHTRTVNLTSQKFQTLLRHRLLPEDLASGLVSDIAAFTSLSPEALGKELRAAAEFSARHYLQ